MIRHHYGQVDQLHRQSGSGHLWFREQLDLVCLVRHVASWSAEGHDQSSAAVALLDGHESDPVEHVREGRWQ